MAKKKTKAASPRKTTSRKTAKRKTTPRKTASRKTGGAKKKSPASMNLREKVHEKIHEHTGLRRLSKYAIFAISILIAALISETIETITGSFVDQKTYTAVIIRMLVILAVYVPLFGFLDRYINQASNKYISWSKNQVRNSRLGLLLGFIAALFILFLLFAYLVHQLNFFQDLPSLLGF